MPGLNTRTVLIEIDPASWHPQPPPPPLVAASSAGSFTVDIDAALIFIGLWTRPPTRPGFTLADCWAWMRYFPAFSAARPLQLCEEWTHVDPHQKTIASDELGVGLTTWALQRSLGFQRYSDTNWVVNVLDPGHWRYRRQARRGPSKSPDYIAEDAAGGLSVLECKGTQTSLAALRSAIERGRPQKENVVPRGGGALIHSLVAGAFVPQADSREPATILVVDPEWKALTDELKRFSADDIRSSTEQVAFAKELSIFDFTESAGALVRATEDLIAPGLAFERDLELRRAMGAVHGDAVNVVKEHFWRDPLERNGEMFIGVRFKGTLDLDKLGPIRRPAAQVDARESIAEATSKVFWREARTAGGLRLTSPVGADYEIEWLART